MVTSCNALLDLRHTPIHLGAGEVLVPVIHRLELAAVDRNAGPRQQTHGAAERYQLRTDLADAAAIVLAEVGNRLVVGGKPAYPSGSGRLARELRV